MAEVDGRDPKAVARAFLSAFKNGDLKRLADLANRDSKQVFAELARDGEKHSRYKSVFSGWRWESVQNWDGEIGEVRYGNGLGVPVASVLYDEKVDEVFVVVLHLEDGGWAVEDLNSPSRVSFERLRLEPP